MQQRESLSAFMDGHKVDDTFIDQLCNDPTLKQQWANYHTIRNVMHGDELILGDDFSAKMEALLENEEMDAPSIQAENVEKPKGMLLKLKRWGTPLMQAGIAASVCLVAVLGVNIMNTQDEIAQVEQPVLKTQPLSGSLQPVSYNAPIKDLATQENLEQQQQRINSLLQTYSLSNQPLTGSLGLSEEAKIKAQILSAEKAKDEKSVNK